MSNDLSDEYYIFRLGRFWAATIDLLSLLTYTHTPKSELRVLLLVISITSYTNTLPTN